MAKVLVTESHLQDIADAIRGKNGLADTYTPGEMAAAITALQGEDQVQAADIPGYVKDELSGVIERVNAVRQNGSILFLAASDAHQSSTAHVEDGNLHAGMAMKALAYALPLDFACFLGDYTAGSSTTTMAEGRSHFKSINADIDEAFRGLPQFRTVGNHDPLGYSYSQNGEALTPEELYSLIGKYNDDGVTVMGSTKHGYCYRDFTEKKLRVICLNTAEDETYTGGAENVSGTQRQWFADALIGAGTKTGGGWGVLILSHHPLDWGNIMSTSHVLKAYIDGTSINIGGVTKNFSGQNNTAYVLQVHGHTHCFKVDKLHWNNSGTGVAYDVWRTAVPNSCFVRNNEYGSNSGTEYYGIEFGETTTYNKTEETGDDTALCVFVLNPSEEKLRAICFGAGYDREIFFGENVVAVTGVTLSAASGTLVPGGSVTLTATVAPADASNKAVLWSSSNTAVATVNNGVVTAQGIGSATITVTTQDGGYTASYALTVVKVPEGNIIDRVGYFDNMRISSSTSAELGWMATAVGYVTTGFIDLSEEPQVIRLKGANFNSNSYWAAYWGIFGNAGQAFGNSGPIKLSGDTIAYGHMSMTYTVTGNNELTITVTATRPGGLSSIRLKFCGYGSGSNLDLRIDEPFD